MASLTERKPIRQASIAAKQKAKAIKFLLDSSSEQFPTLKSLEIEFKLGRHYLQLGFQELYGTTISSYIKELKLKMIKELLKEYSLTLDSIAIETGYNGSEALIRFFKSMEGVSPGQWRKDFLNLLL